MDIQIVQGSIAEQAVDCLVINLFAGTTTLSGATASVDRSLDGAISKLLNGGDFSGDAGTTALLYTNGNLPAPRVLVVGLGNSDEFTIHGARLAAATAAKAAAQLKGVKSIASVIHSGGPHDMNTARATQALVEGTRLAIYRAPQYKREAPEPGLTALTIVEFDTEKLDSIQEGVRAGRILADAVCLARDLSSEPANVLYPETMAERAREMAQEAGLRCTVLDEAAMRAEGMNILLAVSQGSTREAQFIILEHVPPGTEDQPPLVFVGKGVTFDTGGISIKPSADMWYMKDDMSGAGVVLAAMRAIGQLGVQRRIIGVAPCVENMPDGVAFRPGDILTGITGKTTEIISTDAEGRLILADALGYVARFGPRAVIDLATLTGAIGIALGAQAAGLFANDDRVRDELLAAAERSNERLWPMPLYDEYKEDIKSDMAEVKNSG
ncbi:MAG: leucyl aminopeptidase, partial [Caldilineaceae bacterium]|nr:leucyl aminopeptidase [Caldilineaceae bacterium]